MTITTTLELTDLRQGALAHSNGTVTFGLYAPGKSSVHLIGDFNGWDRAADALAPTPEGFWWIEKQLPPGPHAYQFLVDQELVICDPYATALLDDAAADPPRALVEVGRAPFRWRHDRWQRPAFHELIIYELHVGDFSPEGTFQGVIERLGYLKDLGINAIELMPVFEFAGGLGWGYDPAYFFAVEKRYGEPDDFRRLVDQAHAHGIAIILDLVVAHTAHTHPFNKLYPYHESPWYGEGCADELNQFGFPMLDYLKEQTTEFIHDVQEFWLTEYHVDGFRYDYLHGVGCHEDKGVSFLVSSARSLRPDVYLIGEYSPEKPECVNMARLNGAWHVYGSYALKALLRGHDFHQVDSDDPALIMRALDPWQQGYDCASKSINYMESHDEPRLVKWLLEAGLDQQTALRRAALGASLLLTLPGEPMLYHGQEWGEWTPRAANDRNLLHWDQRDAAGKQLVALYRKLCRLRRKHPALCSENYSLDSVDQQRKTIVYHRWHEAGDEVFVAANCSDDEQTISVDFFSTNRWREVLSGRVVESERCVQWTLAPSSAAIFIKA